MKQHTGKDYMILELAEKVTGKQGQEALDALVGRVGKIGNPSNEEGDTWNDYPLERITADELSVMIDGWLTVETLPDGLLMFFEDDDNEEVIEWKPINVAAMALLHQPAHRRIRGDVVIASVDEAGDV